jgi:hypothetical protein
VHEAELSAGGAVSAQTASERLLLRWDAIQRVICEDRKLAQGKKGRINVFMRIAVGQKPMGELADDAVGYLWSKFCANTPRSCIGHFH